MPTAEALALVASHLEDPALKQEACLAAVAIGEKLGSADSAQVAAAMKQMAQVDDQQETLRPGSGVDPPGEEVALPLAPWRGGGD